MLADRPAGSFKRWRTLPPQPVMAADAGAPFTRTMLAGIRDGQPVALRYHAGAPAGEAGGPLEASLVIQPRRLYRRGGHLCVEGTTGTAGKRRCLRLDLMTEVTLTAAR
jgi:hypothetical protein